MPNSAKPLALAALASAVLAVSGCAVGEPLPTTGVTLTTATLNGTIYSSSTGDAEYWWRYGGTATYGSETPRRTIAIGDPSGHPVAESLTGLDPNTTYHVQLCARDETESPPRSNCSADQTFSTASAIGASRIAFGSIRESADGHGSVYVMNPDGTGQTRLPGGTGADGYDSDPAWSPDAAKIAYSGGTISDLEIYSMNADGSGRTRLTSLNSSFAPTWSPDGTRIAFDARFDVWVMNADGTEQLRLTNSPGLFDGEPSWSPDGTKLAITSDDGTSDADVAVIETDGTGLVRLTGNMTSDYYPAWSPDGTKIAYTAYTSSGATSIRVMNANGTGDTELIAGGEVPSWSPDGRKIAFIASDGDNEVFVMDADGSDRVQLTFNSEADFEPAWSPVP